MKQWLGRLIVNFVLCLICFIAYSSQIFIIWPWYGHVVSVELITLLLPFNLLVAMLLWNYFLCVVTDPGQVPANWRPDTHSDGYEVKKLTGTPRFCRVCDKYKPPRTHHCRTCDRCVLRMDHHCPWINNCVGHYNYAHFLRFLFYVDIACFYHLAMLTRRVFYTLNSRFWDEPSSVEILFTILNFVTCIPVFLAVGGFSLYHLYCLLGNSTTIEGWEKNKVATMVRRGKLREVKFPYDLGKRKNVDSVLGPNVLFWCWPRTALGNGIRFDIKDSDGEWTDIAMQEKIIREQTEACNTALFLSRPSHVFLFQALISYLGGPDLWPPSGPTHDYDSPEQDFVLPPTPWTYENGGVNPNLEATNSQRRLIKRSNPSYRRATGVSALPPYHPDYQEPTDNDLIEDSESTDEECNRQGPLVRSGSEGYEVRPVDREELLRRYLLEIGQEPGRYKYYIPTPDEDSDGDSDTPLAAVVDKIERKEHLE